MTSPAILVLTTGGTIDKAYFDALSEYQIVDSGIPALIAQARVALPFRVVELMRKDSLELTDADRALIAAAVRQAPEAHVVITHGTDTMVETARVLSMIPGKTMILTGALNPASFRGSDAEFNIGTAVGAVQSLPPGVYIAMNGRIWDPAKVKKNVSANRFEAV